MTVPVLLIYGQDDQRAPASVAGQLHTGIPRSMLVVLPGAGHAVQVEAADAFNAAARAFLLAGGETPSSAAAAGERAEVRLSAAGATQCTSPPTLIRDGRSSWILCQTTQVATRAVSGWVASSATVRA